VQYWSQKSSIVICYNMNELTYLLTQRSCFDVAFLCSQQRPVGLSWMLLYSLTDLGFRLLSTVCVKQPEKVNPSPGNEGFSIKSDVWSFGITMVITRALLTHSDNSPSVCLSVTKHTELSCFTNPFLPSWSFRKFFLNFVCFSFS